ncbi:hypothetical protein [Thermococcus sp. MAR1]|uniref:hypothetical protein n=1 Tax=Thermococcus sp. MAR1 TaxID=1638263 RepID=UPI00143B04B6|nr:hypothetical protein [Thermococcus sp. MAR1]NJE09337.1 hypothetical protein [Thermococcus sp. MAR1]
MNRDIVIPFLIALLALAASSTALKLSPGFIRQLALAFTTSVALTSIYTVVANFKVRKFVFYDYEPRVVVHWPRKATKRELEFYRRLGILADELES